MGVNEFQMILMKGLELGLEKHPAPPIRLREERIQSRTWIAICSAC